MSLSTTTTGQQLQQSRQGDGQRSAGGDARPEDRNGVPTSNPHYEKLQQASKVLSSRISPDAKVEQSTELSEVLNSSASGDYVIPHNSAWQPFVKSKTINLPDALFEEYDLLQCRCYMGLFPEIEKAWITVDHRLFLWDYQDGSGFTSFEELRDVIIAVALVRPKPGIFIESITHLLVISTPSAVHLIGLSHVPASASKTGKASFQLYILDLTIPTGDGQSLTNLVGTRSGRIFGCSTFSTSSSNFGTGDLYEVVYNAKEGLFSKKCYLVNLTSGGTIQGGASWILPSFLKAGSDSNNANAIVQVVVDQERELLYTRTKNNTIELWNLQKGRTDKVASVRDIRRIAGMLCPGTPLLNAPQNAFDIVGMEIINSKEGKGIGMVAVTTNGIRLYFTHLRGGLRGYGNASSSTPPSVLELVHVRLPPATNSPQSVTTFSQPANNNISISHIPVTGGGFFLCANTVNDDTDVLLLFAPDIGRLYQASISSSRLSLVENAGSIQIEGRTWAIAESPSSGPPNQIFPGNELKAQQTTPGRREWLFLTNMGLHVVTRQRPVDTLVQLLDTAPGGGKDVEIGAFAEAYGRDQTCAMLLSILAGSSAVFNADSKSSYTLGGLTASNEVLNTARRTFYEIGGRAAGVQRGLQLPAGAATANDGKVLLSGRHEGLAIYFARLVGAMMGSKIVVPAPSPQNPLRVETNLPDSMLMRIQRDLSNLRNFLDSDSQIFSALGDQWSGRNEAEAQQIEQDSIHALRLLLTQTIEAISFVLLLIDYRMSEVVASCPPDLARTLVDMTYADLLTTSKGRDIARSLVSAIINLQIGQNLSVEAISDVLQQRCGSFCSSDDVLLYKAIENVRKAKSGPPSERIGNLRESLRLFQKASSHLSSTKLQEVVSEYNSVNFQTGSIDLCLACANAWDPEERGLSWWRDGQPKNDSRTASWEPRNFCYERVLESLQSADDLLDRATESGGKGTVSPDEADSIRSNAYSRALASEDDALHFKLYDWLMARGLTDQLLEIQSGYLELYLLREPVTLERYDLLWQYYARHYLHGKAASVLATLAESTEFALNLNKRLEYLSLASSNAKSQFPSPAMRQDIIGFLTEIDEKLEVGAVQVEIYRQLEELTDLEDHQKEGMRKRLEGRLFSISELYADFAEPLGMLEMMLLIFHVSDHQDSEHVLRTWQSLVDQISQATPSDSDAVSALASKLTSLARRFYPSEVALPLAPLVSMFERFAMEQLEPRSESASETSWIPLALREGGVPYELLFQIYDELFRSRIPPWHTQANAAFLLPSIATVLGNWLQEVSAQGYGSTTYGSFPANEVEEAVGRYLADAGVGSGNQQIKEKLGDVLRDLRRRF